MKELKEPPTDLENNVFCDQIRLDLGGIDDTPMEPLFDWACFWLNSQYENLLSL